MKLVAYLFLFAIGFVAGFLAGRRGVILIGRMLGRGTSNPLFVERCAYGGALATLPVVAVPAYFVGGNFGGSYGAGAFEYFGVYALGAPLGIGLGIALVLGGGAIVGALVGGALGRVVTLTIRRRSAG